MKQKREGVNILNWEGIKKGQRPSCYEEDKTMKLYSPENKRDEGAKSRYNVISACCMHALKYHGELANPCKEYILAKNKLAENKKPNQTNKQS